MTKKLAGFSLVAMAMLTGCSTTAEPAEELGASEQNLWLQGDTWPNREVPVCWNSTTFASGEFAEYGPRTEQAFWRSWVQATGLHFKGWGECDDLDVDGKLVIKFQSGTPNTQTGYLSNESVNMKLNTSRGDYDPVAMHESGHALGFAHEMTRADFADFGDHCTEGNVSGDALNTPADVSSIMAATGYCQNNLALSYWDVVGSQNAYGHPNYFADVTGDGKADAILVKTTGVVVKPASSSSFGSQSTWISGFWAGDKGTFFADVTGDGKADIIGVDNDGIYVRPSSGTGFPGPSQAWTSVSWYGTNATFFADVTGDGKADAIGIDASHVFVLPSSGTSFASTSQDWGALGLGKIGTFFADVTGDGKADAIRVNNDNMAVHTSTGSTFSSASSWLTSGWFGLRTTALADVTGDGKADLVGVDSDGIYVRASTGSGLTPSATWLGSAWYGARGTFFADVTAEGKADLLGVDDDGVMVRTSNGSSFPSGSQSNYTGSAYFADGP